MMFQRYMQPVAIHRRHAERLILLDDHGDWYLWAGEEGEEPIGIPQRLASYLMARREMHPLDPWQQMWFVIADLPVREPASTNPDVMEQGFPR